jgi:alpha-mannosidase
MSRELRRIFVVFKSHLDVGFTGLIDEVLGSYSHVMVPRALEACRQSEAADPAHPFTWTLPAWLLAWCLRTMAGSPEGDELERRVREGRIAWHALPLTTHTELFGLEDLVRGLYVGRELRERFGRTAVAAKMTDVPGHTWILPTLLRAAGVSFLHLGCNPCSTPPDVPRLFHWEGPDGSRLMTMYSRGGYGTPLLPPPDWNLPVWLALQHTSDNVGPQRAEAIQELLRSVQASFPKAQVTIGSLDDFAHALSELKPRLPVVRQDLADSWIHGVGSMPREVSKLRGLRNRLAALESSLGLSMVREPPNSRRFDAAAASFSAAYESLLLFGEHTWGMDTKLGLNPPEHGGRVYDKERFREVLASGKYQRILRSWDDKRSFVSQAERQVREAESLLDEPSGHRTGESGGQRPGPPAVTRLEVINHHAWEWNGLVHLGRLGDGVGVFSEADGEELPTAVLDGETWAAVRALPPLSSVCLGLKTRSGPTRGRRSARSHDATARKDGSALVLENAFVRVRVAREAGGIVSLVNRRSGRDWVDRKAGVPFGAYRYDVYSRREIVDYLKSYAYDLEPWFLDDFGKPGYPAGEHRTFVGTLARASTEKGPGWARLRLAWKQDGDSVRVFGNAPEVEQTITIFDDQPFVELYYAVAAKEECPMLEAGHLVMPLSAARPRFAISRTGSVVDPSSDIARNANRLLHCCDRWVDVHDAGEGLLVIPYDTPLVSIGSPAIERFDGSAGPGAPSFFFNLFNTQWGTNFPQWIGGSLSSRFRLLPHAGDWRKARAWEQAAAALQPPRCRPVTARWEPLAGLMEPSDLPLETVTLKRAEAGDGIILRLREPSGRAGTRTLRFRPPRAGRFQVVVCSLLEDERRPLALSRSGGALRAALSLQPFEVATLKLKL